MLFHNGEEDDLELTHYKLHEDSVIACNYIGHLKSSPTSSSVAITGCLDTAKDRMDVTIISQKNINKMFSVDSNGHAEVIPNPFEEGGKMFIDILDIFNNIFRSSKTPLK